MSAFGLDAMLTPRMCIGVAVICLGILSMAVGARGKDRRGVTLALTNALVIAGYTLVDGIGVRRSGAPAAYTLWIFLVGALPLAAWALRTPAGRAASVPAR